MPKSERIDTTNVAIPLAGLFSELINGAPGPDGFSYMLNGGDAGLLKSLDPLSAEAASARPTGGASIAAHVEHLRYGLSLMNRWAAGENPFKDADWTQAWRITTVTDAEWMSLREALAAEATSWWEVVRVPRTVSHAEFSGMAGSIAHLAYHLGAIRQIDRAVRGPLATEVSDRG
jgi:hypothetical protein